jgi:hypothetical protein
MKKFAIISSIISILALTACGSSSDTTDTTVPANLQTTLATPTYTPGSDEYAAYYAINNFRHSMGLGYWEQNTLLDQSASHHMTYSIANDPTFQDDIEIEGNVGFTGTTPSERAINTGFFTLVDTINAFNVKYAAVGELYALGAGATVVNSMLNTIYHRSGLLVQSTRFIGLARDTTGVATPNTHWWFNHGRIDVTQVNGQLLGGQAVASDYLSNYPINLQTNVPLSMTPENPSVYSNVPAFNFATQTSSPVSFTSAASTNLTVTSFTVTQAGSSTPLPGTVWTIQNDPNLLSSNPDNVPPSLDNPSAPVPTIPNNEAYWVGSAPFLPNTTYNVTFTGSTLLARNLQYSADCACFKNYNSVTTDVVQSWSFTTGN